MRVRDSSSEDEEYIATASVSDSSSEEKEYSPSDSYGEVFCVLGDGDILPPCNLPFHPLPRVGIYGVHVKGRDRV